MAKSPEFIANQQKKQVCKRGHLRVPENLYSRGTCKPCIKATVKAYQQSHRQWVSERGRAWRNTLNGKRVRKNNDLLRAHGITLEVYEQLLKQQGGTCAVCSSSTPKGRGAFHVDHCHRTGKIRGLLCHSCNTIVVPAVEYYLGILYAARIYINEKS